MNFLSKLLALLAVAVAVNAAAVPRDRKLGSKLFADWPSH
jgi:hypothetical protein